jgi:hypothetical protein
MRTDAPWIEIARAVRRGLTQRPQPLVEEEVAPGRILFAPRRSLALLGTVFGMGGAAAAMSVPTHPGAATAVTGLPYRGDDDEGWGGVRLLIHPSCEEDGDGSLQRVPLDAVPPAGHRRDPTT